MNAYESLSIPLKIPAISSLLEKVIDCSGFSVSPKIPHNALAVPQHHRMLADADPPAVGAENLRHDLLFLPSGFHQTCYDENTLW